MIGLSIGQEAILGLMSRAMRPMRGKPKSREKSFYVSAMVPGGPDYNLRRFTSFSWTPARRLEARPRLRSSIRAHWFCARWPLSKRSTTVLWVSSLGVYPQSRPQAGGRRSCAADVPNTIPRVRNCASLRKGDRSADSGL